MHGLACYQLFLSPSKTIFDNLYYSIQLNFISLPYGAAAHFAHCMYKLELGMDHVANLNLITSDCEIGFSNNQNYEFIKTTLYFDPENQDAKICLQALEQKIIDKNYTYLAEAAQMIAKDKHAAFKHLVSFGRFIEARTLFWQLTHDKMSELLFELARDEQCFPVYDFIWEIMRNLGEKPYWHNLLAQVTPLIFCWPSNRKKLLEGAKELVFFHTYRAAALEPHNIELQERLLALYEPGNESFDIEETQLLAERVLKTKPECEQAIRVLELLNKKQGPT